MVLRFFFMFLLALVSGPAVGEPRHGIAMHGSPALPADFTHVRYVNPDAPKGGRLVTGVQGTFDTLNPFVIRGNAPQGLRQLVFETLLTRHYDEPFSLYGLVAQTVDVADDRSSVTFRINPAARFSDGKPISAQDVLFSFNLLKTKGRPNHRGFYSKVKNARLLDPMTIHFDLGTSDDWELPLILGLMPVLPAHAIDPDRFEETGLRIPVGSGPYVVADLKPGETIVLKRRNDYWGRDLPIQRGLHNPNEIRLEFFRDSATLFEAFRKGLIDYRVETDPAQWSTAYDFPAVRSGQVKRRSIKTETPKGFAGFAFNTRREIFGDPRIREGIATLFDFEWINRTYYSGLYRRTDSIFQGSALSASKTATSAAEEALLGAAGARIRDDARKGLFSLPESDGSGQDRALLRRALALFDAGGYSLTNGQLVNRQSRMPLSFEILCATREQERLALAFVRQLSRAGIKVTIRSVDATQYDQRIRSYDFDMTQSTWWNTSLSPGNEQMIYWGSQAGKQPGSRNIAGIDDPAVDRLIEQLVAARDPRSLVAATRALDRTIISGFYAVPLFHLPEQWIAHQERVHMPDESSKFGYLPESWWISPGR